MKNQKKPPNQKDALAPNSQTSIKDLDKSKKPTRSEETAEDVLHNQFEKKLGISQQLKLYLNKNFEDSVQTAAQFLIQNEELETKETLTRILRSSNAKNGELQISFESCINVEAFVHQDILKGTLRIPEEQKPLPQMCHKLSTEYPSFLK